MMSSSLAFLLLQSGIGSQMQLMLPFLLIAVVFYFLVFMPMQKQKKQTSEMQSSLKNGTVVLTSGGIVGTIVTINDDETLIIRVKPDNLKLQVARHSVTGVVPQA
ncbi:MAG TPA: preprotein translocase subunit YajC [Bryobacteraceae bacterium]